MNDVELRPATHTDVPSVASIWYAGWVDGHLGLVPPELIAHRLPESFTPRTRERVPSTWIAQVAGSVVGFVVVISDEVEQIYVDARARGSGVAGVLLRKAEEMIRAAGHETAWLAVVAGNGRARAFYTRQGWVDRGAFSYEAETTAGPMVVPCRRYELDLGDRVA